MIIQLSGGLALSDFRRQRLLVQLQQSCNKLTQVNARFVHFIELSAALDDQQQQQLEAILDYGESFTATPAKNSTRLTVVPRLGTISPWSSKASEIAAHCGLSSVLRIERGIEYSLEFAGSDSVSEEQIATLSQSLHDRMTETVFQQVDLDVLFQHQSAEPLARVPVLTEGVAALKQINQELGLGLSDDELDYLADSYQSLKRDPSDVELMMFAQANSEHCRHKIFNAEWRIDGIEQAQSLFAMIRNTSQKSPAGILSAYSDNAAVVEGHQTQVMWVDPETRQYHYQDEQAHLLMKVETHNHPTAISPFPGAATGCGGEIRDEGATGRGSRSKAGLTGYSVSNLRIPAYEQAWEQDFGKPGRMASALDIMLEAPIGGAAFNNEFGRPNLAGYFRTFEQVSPDNPDVLRGFHKPIMIAGGMGTIRDQLVEKNEITEGTVIVVLGGPSMLIGLGGGAASSQDAGTSSEDLDFASVQRGNPEMQRRCQEVISSCCALGENTPIVSIHDVGAGGLSNAVPEIIHDSNRGGQFSLQSIPTAESGLSPLQLWCNESQERYILALKPEALALFEQICERERCPFGVLGYATENEWLSLSDAQSQEAPIDIPMALLFGNTPKLQRDVQRKASNYQAFDTSSTELSDAVFRVLRFPAVASKNFLITIGDRSVGGLVARDQMVGPWQTPVADVAVTSSGFYSHTGEAMAMGEKSPLAAINAAASGRMAVAEALTNLMAARIDSLGQVKLSANWMAAAGYEGEDAALFDTVKAIGLELCPDLDIAIPVGKDSLSMRSVWSVDGQSKTMVSPMSVVISAFAPVVDVRETLTPELCTEFKDSELFLLDLGEGQNRLGGSALAQVYAELGNEVPDLSDAQLLRKLFNLIQELNQDNLLLAYHDRSDGGLWATLCEMAFAARTGLTIDLPEGQDAIAALFNEELGVVFQVAKQDVDEVQRRVKAAGLEALLHSIAHLNADQKIVINQAQSSLGSFDRIELQKNWAETSYQMQALRDNPECAKQEFEVLQDPDDTGLFSRLTFAPEENIVAPLIKIHRPSVAILREQGVNGQVEMAAAFERAGFDCVDVHMSDLFHGRVQLTEFAGLVACGGFSYGDVLGAGGGWAKSILLNPRIRDQFAEFFARENSFALGVCNGCQMLSQLKSLIPGADHWPAFKRNLSEQFEARVSMVEVADSQSIFFAGMQGSQMPIIVAHGEGRAEFASEQARNSAQIALRYIDYQGVPTETYPMNPNGSRNGVTGVTNEDGRFTIMMPHPERCFRTVQNSWHPAEWGEDGPWLRMFRNARKWLSET